MGVSIQFESHTVELWAIYTMEYDREVLEFFDQPYQLELHYQGPSGRPTKALHTPPQQKVLDSPIACVPQKNCIRGIFVTSSF